MKRRPAIVGQAPSRRGRDFAANSVGDAETQRVLMQRLAITGAIGMKIADLCGCSYAEFRRRFLRRNLIDYWPGPSSSGKGDAWPSGEAHAAAAKLMPTLQGRKIVLLGRKVQRAVYPHWMRYEMRPAWFQWSPRLDEYGTQLAVCPHPSGVNLWWNDPRNRAAARFFWQDLYAEAKECRAR